MADALDTQAQSQSQALNLTLNVGRNSRDPELERRVFNELFSAGSQLGRVAAVLDVLIGALEGNAALQLPEASAAIAAFKHMQSEIAQAKAERSPERSWVRELKALQQRDAPAYDRTVTALRAYLDGAPRDANASR